MMVPALDFVFQETFIYDDSNMFFWYLISGEAMHRNVGMDALSNIELFSV
jgi:hypothetical protein